MCSLLDKAGNPDLSGAAFTCAEPVERQLALQLLQFGSTVLRAAECYKPSVLADYLFQTAQLYSSFYQRSPILKSEPAVRDARHGPLHGAPPSRHRNAPPYLISKSGARRTPFVV